MLPTGQVVMHPGSVKCLVMMYRANDRVRVCQRGELWEIFAYLESRHGRRDRLEFPADIHIGVRLHVERLMLRRAPDHVEHDARPGFAESRARSLQGTGQSGRQADSQRSSTPRTKKRAAGKVSCLLDSVSVHTALIRVMETGQSVFAQGQLILSTTFPTRTIFGLPICLFEMFAMIRQTSFLFR